MAKGTLAVVAVAALVLCAIYGVIADEDDCPSVDNMFCIWKQPVDAECRQETYIELDDGARCPGCQECLRSGELSIDKVLGLDCPIVACPMTELPANCNNVTTHTLMMDVDGKACRRCDTFVCK